MLMMTPIPGGDFNAETMFKARGAQKKLLGTIHRKNFRRRRQIELFDVVILESHHAHLDTRTSQGLSSCNWAQKRRVRCMRYLT